MKKKSCYVIVVDKIITNDDISQFQEWCETNCIGGFRLLSPSLKKMLSFFDKETTTESASMFEAQVNIKIKSLVLKWLNDGRIKISFGLADPAISTFVAVLCFEMKKDMAMFILRFGDQIERTTTT